MYNKINTRLAKLSFALFTVISTNTQAAFYDSRVEKWEFFLAPMVTNSKVLQFENGAEADINKRSSLGFGFGYNIDDHIELTALFSSSNSNYSGTRIIDNNPEDPAIPNGPQKFTSNLYTSKLEFGFTYNLLSSALTPYISANIGSTYIDSGIPTGNIVTGCWWDPWWGYVCTPTAQTYTATRFNYGAGIGLRYDFSRKLYMKGGVAKNYIDLDSSNTPDFTTYQFIFGFMF
ncbi:MAG: outer membrane beta-barrel protein [Gammaproteobacteria bacterium]|nr:outer membrane beta-barrel protein [Gammaproteobacteria bacterium]